MAKLSHLIQVSQAIYSVLSPSVYLLCCQQDRTNISIYLLTYLECKPYKCTRPSHHCRDVPSDHKLALIIRYSVYRKHIQ